VADEGVERLLAQIDERLREQGERQQAALHLQRSSFGLGYVLWGILRYYHAR
jgi:hypothetical protein